MLRFSVCALYYGNYPELLDRSLTALEQLLAADAGYGFVHDVRLLSNQIPADVRARLQQAAVDFSGKYDTPAMLYEQVGGRPQKYPLMRRVVFDPEHPPTERFMWFDDDTFFRKAPTPNWWIELNQQAEEHALVGQTGWLMPLSGNQYAWVRDQPWYNSKFPRPKEFEDLQVFSFTQGAWWVADTEILRTYDYPWLELKHNGGDSMLGELFRHAELPRADWAKDLAVNADAAGRDSASPRRGLAEPRIGAEYRGQPLPIEHQRFRTVCCRYEHGVQMRRYDLNFDPDTKEIISA